MEQTSARLRKTFHYPADNDSTDSLPEVLDEEEQEHLIYTLQRENATRNTLYVRIFLALPILSSLAYLPSLINPSTTLISLLSITSLLSTAWILYALPTGKTGIAFLDAVTAPKQPSSAYSVRRTIPMAEDDSPVMKYLPYLNFVLSGLIAVLAVFISARARSRDNRWMVFGNLPVAMYLVVLMAKVFMGSVDVGELEDLKYRYKGA